MKRSTQVPLQPWASLALALLLCGCQSAREMAPPPLREATHLPYETPADPLPVVLAKDSAGEYDPEVVASLGPIAHPWLSAPTAEMLAQLPEDLRPLVQRLQNLRSPVTRADLLAILPRIFTDRYFEPDPMLRGPNGERLAMGGGFYPLSLSVIRRRERDQQAYLLAQDGDLASATIVPGSYRQCGALGSQAWTAIQVRQRGESQLFCAAFELDLLTFERWENEQLLVTTADLGASSHYFVGRDQWIAVADEAGFHGWLVWSLLGFDLKRCPDRERDVRQALRDNLRYLAGAAEAEETLPRP